MAVQCSYFMNAASYRFGIFQSVCYVVTYLKNKQQHLKLTFLIIVNVTII